MDRNRNSWSNTLISIYAVVLLRCCYIVMFRIHNKELRQTLAAFTCATFGILISGYTGEAPGMPPTNFDSRHDSFYYERHIHRQSNYSKRLET